MTIAETSRLAALLLALTLGGCVAAVPKYVSLDPALPGAEITFGKGYRSQLSISGSSAYDISTDPQGCTNPHNVARLLWTTPESKTVRVEADRRIVVLAGSVYHYAKSVSWNGYGAVADPGTDACVGSGSFVPVAGHSYEVKLLHPFQSRCRLSVIDRATNQAPESLKLDPSARCVGLAD